MKNISQKIGDFSMATVSLPSPVSSRLDTECPETGGAFRPSAARNPTAAKIAPYCSSVAL